MKEYICCHMIAFAAGYVLDLLIGDPHWFPHPVRLMGRLIAYLEKKWNRNRVAGGVWMCITVLFLTGIVTSVLFFGCYALHPVIGIIVEATLTCMVLAAKSLWVESRPVYLALESGDLDPARKALSMIVGRDTERLDRDGITRAAVETVAENTSDGVIAPLCYTFLFGPLGGMLYKAVNTMDSMVGYRNERYLYFGRAAARMDDAANFLPSRLSALLMMLAAAILRIGSKDYHPILAGRIWKRDRYRHKSPNSAQTESTCAGALGIVLGGNSYYGGVLVEKPLIGDPLRPIEKEDIIRAARLMFVSEAVMVAIVEAGLFLGYRLFF